RRVTRKSAASTRWLQVCSPFRCWMWRTIKNFAPLTALIASLLILYRGVIVKLTHDWATDGNYSHGFLIVPFALFLAWDRRARLAGLRTRGSNGGLAILVVSLGILAAGVFGAELFLMRVSLLGVIAAIVLFIWGWEH